MKKFSFEIQNLDNKILLVCSIPYDSLKLAFEAGEVVRKAMKLWDCSTVVIWV